MPSPRFEVPSGSVDNANTIFIVSRPYTPGSVAVFMNGLLQERSLLDGWFETDADAGVVTLKEAPRSTGVPDVIQIFFIDRSAALPETQVVKMRGVIVTARKIKCVFGSSAAVVGRVMSFDPLTGVVTTRKGLRGVATSHQSIKARVRICS